MLFSTKRSFTCFYLKKCNLCLQWVGIDLLASLGLSSVIADIKLSRALRPVRKFAAKTTGLHGLISGKEYSVPHHFLDTEIAIGGKASTIISIDEELGIHDANAIEAEILARRFARRKWLRRAQSARSRENMNSGRRWGFRRGSQLSNRKGNTVSDYVIVPGLDVSPDAVEQRRRNRVEQIDVLLHRGFERLLELQCERDDLLRAPNPLYNYTMKHDPSTEQTFGDVRTTREFNFPSPELVNEYSECHCRYYYICECRRCNPPRAGMIIFSLLAYFISWAERL